MADVYIAFSTDAPNSQVSFNFGAITYVGARPPGFVNFDQDMSEAGVFGDLATTEASDTWLLSSSVVPPHLATIEARDTAIFNGILSGFLPEIFPAYSSDGINSQVTFDFTPVSRPAGYVQWDMGPLSCYGPMAFTEAPDTASFSSILIGYGTLDVTEAVDVAVFFGSLIDAGLAGNLIYTEPSDTAIFNGAVTGNAGVIATTEAPDVAGFVGDISWTALLAMIESPDGAIFVGELGVFAVSSEMPDTAAFIGHVMDVPPVPGVPEVLRFGIPVSLSRW